MTTTTVAAALILAAVLCNSATAQFRGLPQGPFLMGDVAAQFRGFPQGPFPMGGAAGFSMPDWGGGSWMPGFPFSGVNGGFIFPRGGGGSGSGFAGAMGSWKPWVVCSERGPCFRRRLTCPAKCFSSYSRHTKSFVGGGGGGGRSFDCRRSCTAFC